MKTIWVLTSAVVTSLGLLASQAEAQNFVSGNRPQAFFPNPQAPPPDDKKDHQDFGSTLRLIHSLQHGLSGATQAPRLLDYVPMKPNPSAFPPEAFSPHAANFKIPNGLPEITHSHFSMPRGSWSNSVSGRGILGGIGGGIAALFGAIFGRKKNHDSSDLDANKRET